MAQGLRSGFRPPHLKFIVVGAINERLQISLQEISHRPGFQCLQNVSALREVPEVLTGTECHVVVLLQAGTHFISDITWFREGHPDCAVLMVAETMTPPGLAVLLKAGAGGFVFENDAAGDLAEAMCSLSIGEVFISPGLISDMLRHLLNSVPGPTRSGVDSLTDREFIIFKLVGSGLKCSEIARQMNLSTKTVEAHREKIKHRLGFADSGALTRFACGWVQKHGFSGHSFPGESGIPDVTLGENPFT